MSPTPQVAVGIDLGTTFSVVARLDGSGCPRVIPNSEGDLSTPSVVYFHEGGAVVGKEAVKIARFEPDAVAQFAKRDMGKTDYHKAILGHRVPPELVQSLILRRLKQDAAIKLGDFEKAVITVPAYFNEPRRKATMDAGRLAGLEVLDIINEPTAAAFAYGLQDGFLAAGGRSRCHEKILVYDLGGGTFDVTLMEIDGLKYRALATDGDVHLGGIDWDQRIADHVAEEFKAMHEIDLHDDPAAWQALLQEAEDAKRALTSRPKVIVHVNQDGNRANVPLTIDQLESMTGDLVDRTVFTAKNLLREAGCQWRDLTRILLVGGSSRMPMIQKALERESGLALDRSLLTEEPVAMGAAIYAGLMRDPEARDRPEIEVQNISSHPLGVLGIERRTRLPRRKVMIARNTPLPASSASVFPTFRDDQRSVLVKVIEGGDDSGKNATPIGRCVVSGLPPGLPAGTRVKVTFAYATNGRLTVTAELPTVQSQATMTVERASGLTDDDLEKWRRWIAAGAVLETGRDSAGADSAPDEPTYELDSEEYPEAEVCDEDLTSSDQAESTVVEPARTAPASKRTPAAAKADSGSLDDFLKDLG